MIVRQKGNTMVTIKELRNGALYLTIDGKLLHEDYQRFLPMLDEMIAERGSIRCVVEMTGFEGMSLKAAWDDMKYDVTHNGKYERIAVVGDKHWHETMGKVLNILSRHGEARYFDTTERDQAIAWVEG